MGHSGGHYYYGPRVGRNRSVGSEKAHRALKQSEAAQQADHGLAARQRSHLVHIGLQGQHGQAVRHRNAQGAENVQDREAS
mgnify:CR=1 FL=1